MLAEAAGAEPDPVDRLATRLRRKYRDRICVEPALWRLSTVS